MKKLLLVVSVLLCSNANAMVGGPLRGDPNATPFQTLEKAYVDANEVASLDDFDTLGSESNQHCVMALKDSTAPYDAFAWKHTVEQVIPGTPSSGPLFPGEPDRKIVTTGLVVYAYFNGSNTELREIADSVIRNETISSIGNELVVLISQTERYQNSPTEIRVKKNGSTLHFSVKDGFGSTEERPFYGYCWR
jgi:hypothetical protein